MIMIGLGCESGAEVGDPAKGRQTIRAGEQFKLFWKIWSYDYEQVVWDYNNEGAGIHPIRMLYTISNQGPSIATAPKVVSLLK